MSNPTDTNQASETPDELDMFIATHTSVSDDTDDGVYREAEYYALKEALDSLIKKHELRASYSQLLDAYIGLRNAGRELDLIAQANRDRVVNAIQDRLLELKQELEKL